MKRNQFLSVIAIVCFTVFLFGSNALAKQPLIISIGAGGTGGVYYPMMAAVAETMTTGVKEIKNATAQVTGASFENVRLLQNGYVQFILANAAALYDGYQGNKPFKKPLDKLRTICWAHASDYCIVTLKNSGINTFEDIIDKRFSVGSPGAGQEIELRRVLGIYGLSYKNFKVQFLSIGGGINALKDGRVDATVVNAGTPTSALLDLAFVKQIHLISFSEAIIDQVVGKYPFYSKAVIPASTYKGFDQDLKVLASPAIFSCTAELPEDVVYKVTKAIYKKMPWLVENIHRGFGKWKFEPDIQRIAPMHPGAVKFYKEIGKM